MVEALEPIQDTANVRPTSPNFGYLRTKEAINLNALLRSLVQGERAVQAGTPMTVTEEGRPSGVADMRAARA